MNRNVSCGEFCETCQFIGGYLDLENESPWTPFNGCKTCKPGYSLGDDKACRKICSEGSFLGEENKCEICSTDMGCKACVIDSTNCTRCEGDFRENFMNCKSFDENGICQCYAMANKNSPKKVGDKCSLLNEEAVIFEENTVGNVVDITPRVRVCKINDVNDKLIDAHTLEDCKKGGYGGSCHCSDKIYLAANKTPTNWELSCVGSENSGNVINRLVSLLWNTKHVHCSSTTNAYFRHCICLEGDQSVYLITADYSLGADDNKNCSGMDDLCVNGSLGTCKKTSEENPKAPVYTSATCGLNLSDQINKNYTQCLIADPQNIEKC